MMDKMLETTSRQRKAYIDMLSGLSMQQLNTIPEGFNNNILWNLGHIVATQQLLVYSLSGERWTVDKELIKAYRNGTRPERLYTEADRQLVIDNMLAPIQATHTLRAAGGFSTYQPFKLPTGFEITDYDSAVLFNLFHEGLHMGYVFSINKFV